MKKMLAKDDPRFMEWFQPEYNPHVDLDTLPKWDDKIILIHIWPNGKIQRITAKSLFLNNSFSEVNHSGKVLAKDDPEFTTWFQPEYNPHINLDILSKSDDKAVLIHKDRDGFYATTSLLVFKNNYSRPKGRRRYMLAVEFSWFPDWFQIEENEGLDVNQIHINDDGYEMKHREQDGEVWSITPKELFSDIEITHTLAVLEDPEIAFFATDSIIRKVRTSSTEDREKLLFRCPYCGGTFVSSIASMVGASPKCLICKDVGFEEEWSDLTGSYLFIR